MRRALPLLVLALGLLAAPPAPAADGPPADLLLILDASGSMWGQIEGENKIVIARRVLGELLAELPAQAEVGLVAYGHRREGDCADVETVAAPGALGHAALGQRVEALNPKGKTPLAASIEHAVELVRAGGAPATVILVSDGLETCGGDPCRAVGEARQSGVELVLHVIGFDVGGEDVSQLECAAQAGGGLYLGAGDADELATALEAAVAVPADQPAAVLSVEAVADGELADAIVRVLPAGGGEEVVAARTYNAAATNPRRLPLAAGTYDVEVEAVRITGARKTFTGVVVAEGETVERRADFSSGELAVTVTRNGELSDASVHVYPPGGDRPVDSGRTYNRAGTNPRIFRLPAGTYDVEIVGIEIAGAPGHRFTTVEIPAGGRAERAHEFASGTLAVGVVAGDQLVDAVVNVFPASGAKAIAAGRSYTAANSNPKRFELAPGRYRVTVKPVKLSDSTPREAEVEIQAGEETEHRFDYGDS